MDISLKFLRKKVKESDRDLSTVVLYCVYSCFEYFFLYYKQVIACFSAILK